MEVLTFETHIERINIDDLLIFNENRYFLWVIHADKIPPHIGLSSGQSFFSLKANGKDIALAVDRLISVLRKKNIATLLYEVDSEVVINTPEETFAKYTTTIPGEITCLEPLKDFVGDTNATWIKELLQNLEVRGALGRCYGWQLPENFVGISEYRPQDIHKRLSLLANV